MDGPSPGPFRLEEATIASIGDAIRSGAVTARELVEAYRERVDRFDRLNAYVRLDDRALDRADALDEQFAASGPVGPLHGVPVAVKDNVDVAGLPTTAGSPAMADAVPDEDATLVSRLVDAGAIVLGKTALDDFARDWHGRSSLSGRVRNPYAADRITGGSSAGTAAAVAANLAAVGIGSDTGGSVRLPAAYTNLVGLRPTVGLVSREGLVPISLTHDTAGPMTRTVRDAALVLDAIVGFDPDDPVTARGHARGPPSAGYDAALDSAALDGARLGLLTPYLDAADGAVSSVVKVAVELLEAGGATVVGTAVPETDLADFWPDLAVPAYEYERDVEAYLARYAGRDVPDTVAALMESGGIRDELLPRFESSAAVDLDGPEDRAEYHRRLVGLAAVEDRVLEAMASADVQALVYPTAAVPPVPAEGRLRTAEMHTPLAAATGFPAISVPAGFTGDGLPVGLELLGRPFDESTLIGLAEAFESATGHRRPPAGVGD